jgi:hypothetical protein
MSAHRKGLRTADRAPQRTWPRAIAAAAVAGSVLWAGGVASATPAPRPADRPQPTVTAKEVEASRMHLQQIADDLGVSPARLSIECHEDGSVVVYWNNGVVGSWWDPYCALSNWVESLF